MTALEQVNEYLKRLRRRLRLFAAWRGAALVAGLAVALTLALVWIANRNEFAQRLVLPFRVLLYAAIVAAIILLIAIPVSRLTRRRVARLAEKQAPEFEERLLTVTERPDTQNPFTELIAEDTLRVARQRQPEQFRSARAVASVAGSGVFAATALLWLITSAPGYWGYGASLLWTGSASATKRPLYDVIVKPGNKTIRRRTDQTIRAQTVGFSPQRVTLFAKYGSGLRWEQAAMQANGDGGAYEFLLAGLAEPVEYYVTADAAQSKHFTIRVKDLAGVKRVKVALHYPAGLGLTDEVQDPGGDVRAVEGTQAEIGVLTDRPLERGLLVTEDGHKIDLQKGENGWLTARMGVDKDGAYHVAALEEGETIRISEDYFIEARKDEPPSVKIVRPGRDLHVSPIEEVPVEVDAADDFGLRTLELHYSVNGGPEQMRPLSKGKDVKQATGKTMIAFEDLKLAPGDVVSFYATARDATKAAQSDIIFAQADPFDYKFSQSQQAGGSGSGTGMADQENISERQKQIIAATFNELKDKSQKAADQTRGTVQERARFLADLEEKLGAQAKTLADRMASREISTANSQLAEFSRLMTQASGEMQDATGQLKPGRWHDALGPEQQALRSILRAEALFRDLQVAFGQQGGGGAGGGAQRDLARMFDLELDTSKNQYETGQTPAQKDQDQQKAIDAAFERLQMLAKRQQELADQKQSQQQAFEQRWQEEQLRRQAEELRRQMEQLSQDTQGESGAGRKQTQPGQQSAGGGAASAEGREQSASTRAQQQQSQALRSAANSLQRAEEEMRKAVSKRDGTAQRQAAERMQEAQETLNRMLHDQAGNSVGDLAGRAEQIAGTQKELAERIKQMYGGVNGRGPFEQERPGRQLRDFSGEGAAGTENGMPAMNDPNSVQFGYGFRRRNWPPEMEPRRAATDREKALAGEKEQLADQLEQLQRGIQEEAQRAAGAQPGVSSKLRKALSDAEQKELAVRMQKNAEWMRQGYGDRNLGMEDSVTAGIEQLSRDLQDAERSVNAQGTGAAGQNDRTSQALGQIQALRERLEREQSGRGNRDGQGAEQPTMQEGARAGYGPMGSEGAAIARRGAEDAMAQLNSLRRQVDPKDRALGGYFDDALGSMRHLTGAQAGLLDERLSRDAASSLQRLELELSKRAGQAQLGARTGAPEATPQQYRDAVAEYFKKLSK